MVRYLIQFLLQFQVRLFDHRKPPEALKKYIWPRGMLEWDLKKWPFFVFWLIQLTLERSVKKLRQNQNKLRIFVVICKTLMSLHIIMSCWLHYSKLCKETKKCDKIASNNNTQLASFFQACFASQSRYNRGCLSPTLILGRIGSSGQEGIFFNYELWPTIEGDFIMFSWDKNTF